MVIMNEEEAKKMMKKKEIIYEENNLKANEMNNVNDSHLVFINNQINFNLNELNSSRINDDDDQEDNEERTMVSTSSNTSTITPSPLQHQQQHQREPLSTSVDDADQSPVAESINEHKRAKEIDECHLNCNDVNNINVHDNDDDYDRHPHHDDNDYGGGDDDNEEDDEANETDEFDIERKEMITISDELINYSDDYSCGLCSLRPKWLQKFANKQAFLVIFCLTSILQGMYYTYFVSILTTIEKLYQIQSKTSGIIISATEIGQIAGSLLLTYYGGQGHRPKWIASGMLLFALGSILSAFPHFIFGIDNRFNHIYSTSSSSSSSLPSSSSSSLLNNNNLNDDLNAIINSSQKHLEMKLCLHFYNNDEENVNETISLSTLSTIMSNCDDEDNLKSLTQITYLVLAIFFISRLLIGFGATAISNLGIPYIDDNIAQKESPFYFGITIGVRIFGPVFGFLLGSLCTNIFVNFPFETSTLITPNDPNWICAWWLGVLIVGITLMFTSFTMMAFPKHLPQPHPNSYSHKQKIKLLQEKQQQQQLQHPQQQHHHQPQTCVNRKEKLKIKKNFINRSENLTEQTTTNSKKKILNENCNYLNSDNEFLDEKSLLNDTEQSIKAIIVNNNNNYNVNNNNNSINKTKNHLQNVNTTATTTLPPARSPTTEAAATTNANIIKASKSINRSSSNDNKCNNSDENTFTLTIKRLFKNRILLLRTASSVLHLLPIAGVYTFLPKYFESQFHLTASEASIICAIAGILIMGIGVFASSLFMSKYKPSAQFVSRWIALSALFYSIGMIILSSLGCESKPIFGINYESEANCGSQCSCVVGDFSPICVNNNVTYMSPCFAGCTKVISINGSYSYEDCKCLADELNVVKSGSCKPDCDNLFWYIIVFSLFVLVHSTSEVGSMLLNLRCVEPQDKAMALGLISFAVGLFGNVPCPIIYGAVIDSACVFWENNCGQAGACRVYDSFRFRIAFHGLTALIMLLAFIVDTIVCCCASNIKFDDESDNEIIENVDVSDENIVGRRRKRKASTKMKFDEKNEKELIVTINETESSL